MLPSEKALYRPKGGWREHGWYVCDMAVRASNPIHRVLFYTGFLNEKGEPTGYSGSLAINYADDELNRRFYYLKPVYFIGTTEELEKLKPALPVEFWRVPA